MATGCLGIIEKYWLDKQNLFFSRQIRKSHKLFQIAEKASAKKKARIYKNNLGTKKRVQQNRKIKQQIRTHCFKAAHSVVDDAAQVIAEDLTSPIPKKNQWKQFNRLMNSWMKGAITEALEKVTNLEVLSCITSTRRILHKWTPILTICKENAWATNFTM